MQSIIIWQADGTGLILGRCCSEFGAGSISPIESEGNLNLPGDILSMSLKVLDLGPDSAPFVLTLTGLATFSSNIISNPSSTSGLVVGQPISGNGVPANTTITAISPTSITLSNALIYGGQVLFTVGLLVTTYTASLTPLSVLQTSLQTTGVWRNVSDKKGGNFSYMIPASAFPNSGNTYIAQLTITTNAGEVGVSQWIGPAQFAY